MIRSATGIRCAVLTTLFAGVALGQQRSIVIRALDGKTGKPLANQRLVGFGGKSEGDARFKQSSFEATTAKDGTAVVTIGPGTQWIQVWVDRLTLCQDKPNFRAFRVDTIAATGDSSPNQCGRVAVKNIPGTFTVFARTPTWREKMEW